MGSLAGTLGTGRVMCIAEANGVLYAAGGIRNETPLSGGLFRAWTARRRTGSSSGAGRTGSWNGRRNGDSPRADRRPDPLGGQEVLLGTCSYPGVDPPDRSRTWVRRHDRARHPAVLREGLRCPALSGPCLSAYNDFLPAADPDTGRERPPPRRLDSAPGARGLPRARAPGPGPARRREYSHGRIFDPAHPVPSPRGGCSLRGRSRSPRSPRTGGGCSTWRLRLRPDRKPRHGLDLPGRDRRTDCRGLQTVKTRHTFAPWWSAIAAFLVYAGPVFAQQTAPGTAAFQRLDRNRDGKLTQRRSAERRSARRMPTRTKR